LPGILPAKKKEATKYHYHYRMQEVSETAKVFKYVTASHDHGHGNKEDDAKSGFLFVLINSVFKERSKVIVYKIYHCDSGRPALCEASRQHFPTHEDQKVVGCRSRGGVWCVQEEITGLD
jgi:hypothetical protein